MTMKAHMRVWIVLITILRGAMAAPFEDMPPSLLSHGWEPVHDRMIAVRYVNLVLNNHRREFSRAAFRISSPDDPAYATAREPVRQSYWVRPARYTMRKAVNIKHTWVYLELPEPMKAGATYTVTDSELTWLPLAVETGLPIRNQPEPTPAVTNLWRGDTVHRSPSLQVNQVGYLPGVRKYGYLMQFAGYEGASHDNPVDADFGGYETFNVVDAATGEVKWRGPVGSALLDGEKDRLSQSRVWRLDFSDFTTPGRYRLQVPGVGVSYPFSIGPDVYNHAFGVLMRGMYHQRCGTALEAPWTRHTHPACHMDDAIVPQLEQYRRPELDFFPQQVGETFHCVGGHHDAGDFGKYTINGATVVYALLQPFEVYPDRLGFDQSPVPEAGNGIPDIIEEAKWELNWLSGMQDPEDGGVHIIVKPHPTGSYEDSVSGQPSPGFSGQRSLWWKDTHATAAFAAALARAARTPDIIRHWPEDAARYLEQAEKAWEFCMAHTEEDGSPLPIVGGHHYGGILGAQDEYAWMAVELWLTTGEQKYHDYFLKHHDLENAWHWSWWPLIEAGGHATRSYAYGLREGKDPEMLRQCLEGDRGVITAARHVLRWQNEWATRPSFATDAFRFNRWGWYFLSDIASYDLLLAASLVEGAEREAFLQGALFNADQEFGNSADNRTTITGIGARRPVDIVHQNALYDGRVEPPPGIPLGFHPAGMNRGRSDRGLMVSHTVGDLPIAYRYVDCWNIDQEFTIDRQTKTLMTYAMLANVTQQRGGFPALSITANGDNASISGILPYTVRFTADTAGANGKQVREVFWDLNNEETHVGFDFTYTFTVPGRYVVVATATDEAGWPAFAEVEVLVRPPASAQPNQGRPWRAENNTYGLWRFDDGLRDDTAQRPAELVGNARMTGENVLWMANPAGQSVRLDAAGDGIRIPLPNDLLSDKTNKGFTIDAMMLYEQDVRKGGGHCHILMVHSSWDMRFGLFKGTWNDREIQGLPGDFERKDAVNLRVTSLTRPRPAWVHMQLGFERGRGMAFLAVDGERVEWPFTPPENERDLVLQIGGFHGYVDEVRVNIHR